MSDENVTKSEFQMALNNQALINERLTDSIEKLTAHDTQRQVEIGQISSFINESKWLIRALVLAAIVGVGSLIWENTLNGAAEQSTQQQLIEVLKGLKKD